MRRVGDPCCPKCGAFHDIGNPCPMVIIDDPYADDTLTPEALEKLKRDSRSWFDARIQPERSLPMPPHLVPSSTPVKNAGPAAGRGCPKCGGLRQWPMGCVIRLPDEECQAPHTDVLGIASDFVGYAGRVVVDPTLPPNCAVVHGAQGTAAVIKDGKVSAAPTIDVLITAAEWTTKLFAGSEIAGELSKLPGGGRFMIPAKRLAELYRDAVIAEMHPTVKSVVNIKIDWLKPGDEFSDGKRASVAVSARYLQFAFSGAGMSYMFELRDAVDQVIRDFVPPSEAWVAIEATEAAPQGDKAMGNTVAEIEQVLEEVTGKPDVIKSTVTVVSWFGTLLEDIMNSPNPAATAAAHLPTIRANAGNLAQAVASTPAGESGEATQQIPPTERAPETSQSAQHG